MLDKVKTLSFEGEIADLMRRAKEVQDRDYSLIEGGNNVSRANNWDSCAYATKFYAGLIELEEEEVKEDAMQFIRNYTLRPEIVNIDMATIISYIDVYQKIEEKLTKQLELNPDSTAVINDLMRKNEQVYQLLHAEHIKRVKWIPKNAFKNINSIENFYYMMCVKIKDQDNAPEHAKILVEALEDLVFVLGGFTALKMMDDQDKSEVEQTVEKLNDIIAKISRLII
jgi:hypothetical protein